MTTLKKIIFLNNDQKDSMGILTIEKKDNSIFGTLKTYGNQKLEGSYILGIKTKENIIKQNINFVNQSHTFIVPSSTNLNEKIGCVLLGQKQEKYIPIIWGSEKMNEYKESVVNHINACMQKLVESQTKLSTVSAKFNTAQTSSENVLPNKETHINIATTPQAEIALACDTCASLFESSDDEIESIIDEQILNDEHTSNRLENITKGTHKFFDMISDQLYELFNRYPSEGNLSKLIDNSQWVKIIDDYDNINHVVGIIKDGDDIKYICYGVKGNYYQEPPIEMRGYSQWLPIDIDRPEENGYWTMYQDADTGENIPIN